MFVASSGTREAIQTVLPLMKRSSRIGIPSSGGVSEEMLEEMLDGGVGNR